MIFHRPLSFTHPRPRPVPSFLALFRPSLVRLLKFELRLPRTRFRACNRTFKKSGVPGPSSFRSTKYMYVPSPPQGATPGRCCAPAGARKPAGSNQPTNQPTNRAFSFASEHWILLACSLRTPFYFASFPRSLLFPPTARCSTDHLTWFDLHFFLL